MHHLLLNITLYNHMQITSVPELRGVETLKSPTEAIVATRDHDYTPSITHPLTRTRHRYVVGDRFHDGPGSASHKKKTCKYHNMRLCPELRDYQSVTSEVINAKIKSIRLKSSSQQNALHYFFYNRLMDYFHNMDIVQQQYADVMKSLRPGELITRDMLMRFVIKQS